MTAVPLPVPPEMVTAADFSRLFKARMIAAYPVISQMTSDEAYGATVAEWDAAFERILASRNLRRTCLMELEKRGKR